MKTESLLILNYIVRREVVPSTGDGRRIVNSVVASYEDAEGYEYRKRFESYGTPIVPEQGTSKDLNAQRFQWTKSERKTR